MSSIGEILPLERVVLDWEASSKRRLFEEVGLFLENQIGVARGLVYDALLTREKICSTGFGQGVAIPHARMGAQVRETVGMFIRMKEPVPFDAPDGKPVVLVFVLLVPENAGEQHLGLLSQLASRFSVKAVREGLLAAESAEAAHALLLGA